METRLILYCRRCRQPLGEAEPGQLVGCLDCRILTRSTLAFCKPPCMVITVAEDTFGFRVRIGAGPQFGQVLAQLKATIPRKQRDYERGVWFVHKRGIKKLERWLEQVRELGAEVKDRRGQARKAA